LRISNCKCAGSTLKKESHAGSGIGPRYIQAAEARQCSWPARESETGKRFFAVAGGRDAPYVTRRRQSGRRDRVLHVVESIMIDHVGFSVSDYARAKAFYERALAPLGYTLVMEATAQETGQPAAGFGSGGKPDFWIGGEGKLEKPVHIAIVAKDRLMVDAFYRAALAAGGNDNGAPGLRPHYHPNYYGAFVLDPDGHNIEAVCHAPV
jgi:catechol 2,3-dioxygenase-like lactoylglutathione lyase family enzyme